MTMTKYGLAITDGPALRFTGELIGSAASSDNNALLNYSGSTGCWTELALYRTARGKLICYRIDRTRWQGEHDRFTGKVCESEAEVIEFFGHGRIAQELYEDAGIENVTEIE